jgi:catechol 2,3-dioxygenase-like lactoylglutathione lyase family enzyme
MTRVSAIHHVTAIAGDAQQNLDFYTGVALAPLRSAVEAVAP